MCKKYASKCRRYKNYTCERSERYKHQTEKKEKKAKCIVKYANKNYFDTF